MHPHRAFPQCDVAVTATDKDNNVGTDSLMLDME